LNALQVDPIRVWKGAWRWYAEDMLDCCVPINQVIDRGITVKEWICLAKCNGLIVEYRNPMNCTLEEFKSDLQSVTNWKFGNSHFHMVVSYSRKTFMQSGDGHFSPIGGYCPDNDYVLIMDVARFKYPPHWVPLELLYNSMKELDPETGLPRGWMILSAKENTEIEGKQKFIEEKYNVKLGNKPLYFVLLNQGNNWKGFRDHLDEFLKSLKEKAESGSNALEELYHFIIEAISNNISHLGLNYIPLEIQEIISDLRFEISSTPL
jgi:hypothetical protein